MVQSANVLPATKTNHEHFTQTVGDHCVSMLDAGTSRCWWVQADGGNARPQGWDHLGSIPNIAGEGDIESVDGGAGDGLRLPFCCLKLPPPDFRLLLRGGFGAPTLATSR